MFDHLRQWLLRQEEEREAEENSPDQVITCSGGVKVRPPGAGAN